MNLLENEKVELENEILDLKSSVWSKESQTSTEIEKVKALESALRWKEASLEECKQALEI